MPQGTVKFYNVDRGFGFIELGGGAADVFVHATAIVAPALSLQEGARVEFEMGESRKNGKACATNVRPIPPLAGGGQNSANGG